MAELILSIAEINIRISSSIKGIIERFNEFYCHFIVEKNKTIHHTIEIRMGDFKVSVNNPNFDNSRFKFNGYGYDHISENHTLLLLPTMLNAYRYTEEFLIYLFSQKCLTLSKFLFHSATYINEKESFVFFGPSCIGKSTLSKKFNKSKIFSDDMVVIEKHGTKYKFHKTPFERDKSFKKPVFTELNSFYRLVQSSSISLKKMSQGESLNAFIANLWFIDYTKETYSKSIKLCNEILSPIMMYELKNHKNSTSKELLNKISNEQNIT